MRTTGLFFQIFFSLVVTSNSQTAAQGGAESPNSFINNAMKLREDVLFKLEPVGVQRTTDDADAGQIFLAHEYRDHDVLDWGSAQRQ